MTAVGVNTASPAVRLVAQGRILAAFLTAGGVAYAGKPCRIAERGSVEPLQLFA